MRQALRRSECCYKQKSKSKMHLETREAGKLLVAPASPVSAMLCVFHVCRVCLSQNDKQDSVFANILPLWMSKIMEIDSHGFFVVVSTMVKMKELFEAQRDLYLLVIFQKRENCGQRKATICWFP